MNHTVSNHNHCHTSIRCFTTPCTTFAYDFPCYFTLLSNALILNTMHTCFKQPDKLCLCECKYDSLKKIKGKKERSSSTSVQCIVFIILLSSPTFFLCHCGSSALSVFSRSSSSMKWWLSSPKKKFLVSSEADTYLSTCMQPLCTAFTTTPHNERELNIICS